MVTHQLQVKRRTGKVRRPETDVLLLCHATNVSMLIAILILSVTIQMIVAYVLLFTFSRNHWSVSLGLRDTDSLKDVLATFGGHTTMLTAGLDF